MTHLHRIRLPELTQPHEYRSIGFQRSLWAFLHKGSQEAFRLRVEGRSRAAGNLPKWLKHASEIEFLGYEEERKELLFTAPKLGAVMEADDRQPLFPPSWTRDQSILEVLEDSIHDAVSASPTGEWLDDGLLRTLEEELKPMLGRFPKLSWENGRSVDVSEQTLPRFAALRTRTPQPQECRVVGKLEAIRHSTHAFMLVLDDGTKVRGIAAPEQDEKLKGHWGERVLVLGQAVFRPSMDLLRVDAREIEAAEERDDVWSFAPKPLFPEAELKACTQPQSKSGVRSTFGKWPGDETDEQILEALRNLR